MATYDLSAIEHGLKGCLAAIPSTMPLLADAINNSMAKLHEPMQLAIIGKISSSKSTLVNAMLGKPELMSTGQKEVTYNVGWLKYGSPDSDIIIHHKDGSAPTRHRPDHFAKFSADATAADVDNISYIEVFDDAEILRDINIIDTPGLDAFRQKDSQNTLDFISRVRPDAVLMLFTHAVAENTLDVVRQFNAGASFNPLNAIGVLSKIDVLWQETIPRDKAALQIGRRMVDNRKKKDENLRRTLFDLYPISALLYLASSTVRQQEIDAVTDAWTRFQTDFAKSLGTVKKFLESEAFDMPAETRRCLLDRMGLYGIWLVMNAAKSGAPTDVDSVRELFFRESGARDFSLTLRNHFGARARLIKLESIYQNIRQAINKTKARAKDPASQRIVAVTEQRVSELFSALVHEHAEYELLRKIYDGKIDLDPAVVSEFRLVCGEFGTSAPERLGMPAGTPAERLLEKATERERFWRGEVAMEPDPEEREWMKVILKSYTLLRGQIRKMKYDYDQARSFLFND